MKETESMPMPPNVRVFELAAAMVVARALWVAAELGVADHLDHDPRPVDDLAAATGAHAGALYRVLRLLATVGICREQEDRRFTQTEMSATLRSDHPTHTRSAVRMLGSEPMWRSFGAMRAVLDTGRTGWSEALGEPIFDWMGRHPQDAALFNDAMIGIHGGETPAVAAAYRFSGTVIDVGGGSANMMVHILREHPGVQGVVFDLPRVADAAQRRLKDEALDGRCAVQSGSFFEAVPEGGDAYVLSHIIHDWDEERCIRILENCRTARKPGGKVLIVEMVVPPPNEPHPAKMLDLVMLTIPGGQERTADEYRSLLSKAGLELLHIIPTHSPVSIVEAQ